MTAAKTTLQGQRQKNVVTINSFYGDKKDTFQNNSSWVKKGSTLSLSDIQHCSVCVWGCLSVYKILAQMCTPHVLPASTRWSSPMMITVTRRTMKTPQYKPTLKVVHAGAGYRNKQAETIRVKSIVSED